MTDKSGTSRGMTPEVQIRCSITEAMENIGRAIFGENLRWETRYHSPKHLAEGVVVYEASAFAESVGASVFAEVPIGVPNAEHGDYYVVDQVFKGMATNKEGGHSFEAWCEHNPNSGALAVVRCVERFATVRWLVAEALEGEVLFQGQYDDMSWELKQVVRQHWSVSAYLAA